MSVVRGFSKLYENDIKPMYQECYSNLKTHGNLKDKVVEILKTTENVFRKIMIYYPKTMLIAFIANAIFTVLLPSVGAIIRLAIHCYIFSRNQHFMFSAIIIHKENKISELFSSYEAKQRLEALIYLRAYGKELLERITSFFKRRM